MPPDKDESNENPSENNEETNASNLETAEPAVIDHPAILEPMNVDESTTNRSPEITGNGGNSPDGIGVTSFPILYRMLQRSSPAAAAAPPAEPRRGLEGEPPNLPRRSNIVQFPGLGEIEIVPGNIVPEDPGRAEGIAVPVPVPVPRQQIVPENNNILRFSNRKAHMAAVDIYHSLVENDSIREIKYKIRRLLNFVPSIRQVRYPMFPINLLEAACTCLKGAKRRNVVRRLLKAGADAKMECHGGRTILSYAWKDKVLFYDLVVSGADMNARETHCGRTGIQLVSDEPFGTGGIKRYLLYDADVGIQDYLGMNVATEVASTHVGNSALNLLLTRSESLRQKPRLRADVYEIRAVVFMIRGKRAASRRCWNQALRIRESKRFAAITYQRTLFMQAMFHGISDITDKRSVRLALRRSRFYKQRLALMVFDRIFGSYRKPTQLALFRVLNSPYNKFPVRKTITTLGLMLGECLRDYGPYDEHCLYVLAQFNGYLITILGDKRTSFGLELVRNGIVNFKDLEFGSSIILLHLLRDPIPPWHPDRFFFYIFQFYRTCFLLCYITVVSFQLFTDEREAKKIRREQAQCVASIMLIKGQSNSNVGIIREAEAEQVGVGSSRSTLENHENIDYCYFGRFWEAAGPILRNFNKFLSGNPNFHSSFWMVHDMNQLNEMEPFCSTLPKYRFEEIMGHFVYREPVQRTNQEIRA